LLTRYKIPDNISFTSFLFKDLCFIGRSLLSKSPPPPTDAEAVLPFCLQDKHWLQRVWIYEWCADGGWEVNDKKMDDIGSGSVSEGSDALLLVRGDEN